MTVLLAVILIIRELIHYTERQELYNMLGKKEVIKTKKGVSRNYLIKGLIKGGE